MNGLMKNNKYLESLKHMDGPYTKSNIPNIEIDLRGLVAFANKMGKTVPELTDSEIEPFILNATMQDVRRVQLKSPM